MALEPLLSELALNSSTVTDFAGLRGLSMSQPFFRRDAPAAALLSKLLS